MPAQTSYEVAVWRTSIRLTNAWIVTKRKKDPSRFLKHTKDHLAQFSEKNNSWWERPFYVKFWLKLTPLEWNRPFLVDIRS